MWKVFFSALVATSLATSNGVLVNQQENYNSQYVKESNVALEIELLEEKEKIPVFDVPIECLCVYYIQNNFTGSKFRGNAIEWKKYINSKEPIPGSIIVIDTKPLGHIGKVLYNTEETVSFISQNLSEPCKIETAIMQRDNPIILGYIRY